MPGPSNQQEIVHNTLIYRIYEVLSAGGRDSCKRFQRVVPAATRYRERISCVRGLPATVVGEPRRAGGLAGEDEGGTDSVWLRVFDAR